MNIPYIGITDFTEFAQVEKMLSVFNNKKGILVPRRLHVGVMMSYKTLNGIETKWSKAFPKNESIAEIFSSKDKETMNCLHYADYENINFEENLTKAISFGGEGINAIQLDMVWPDRKILKKVISGFKKDIEVILQVNKVAIELDEENPSYVANHISLYDDFITHVLLDKSMGKGLGMDAKGLIPYIEAIKDRSGSWIDISVAGGLGPTSLDLVKPILKKFPDTSFDAQGRLRPSGNALDPIDWNLAEEYLIRSLELVS